MASAHELDRRYHQARTAMESAGYRALVVAGNSEFNQRGYIRYLADWRLFGGSAYLVLPLEQTPMLIMGLGAQAEWAKELSAIPDTRAVLSKITGVADALREVGADTGRVGVVGLSSIMPHGDVKALQQALPAAQLEDATGLIEATWCILSDEGLAEVEHAHEQVARVFAAFRAALAPGRSEREVVADAYQVAVRQGCLEGMIHVNQDDKSGTRPATDRRFQPGDIVKMFMEFLTPSGYLIELGGCFSFAPPPPAKARKFEMTAAAIDQAIAATRPGVVAGEIVELIHQLYVDAGWEVVGRRLWDFHGQGMHSLLKPFGLPGSTDLIQERMMINIHPGILTADGFGVSATNNYVVGPAGGRALGGFRHQWHVVGD